MLRLIPSNNLPFMEFLILTEAYIKNMDFIKNIESSNKESKYTNIS